MAVPVDRSLVGFVDSAVSPTDDPARLGRVRLTPSGPFAVREHVTLQLHYTVGHHGIDDRGSVKVVLRFPADGGAWQVDDPEARNYVTARTPDGACDFRLRFEAYGHARPWFKVLTVQVVGGCLREGETLVLTLGDRSGGSEGLRLQTFVEEAWELRFLVDPCATGHFVEVPDPLWVSIVAGPPTALVAVAPTGVVAGAPFRLCLKAEDAHGNPTDRAEGIVRLRARPHPVAGLPETVHLTRGTFATVVEGLTCSAGPVWIEVEGLDGLSVRSNPICVHDDDSRLPYWGDLHGQSGETVGINSAEAYLTFARDRAFLDVTSHQGNAFQITNGFWQQLNDLTARFDVPGRFVCLPGYEWSGNTAVGGDRNVYFRHEGRPIRRSSHALLLDRSDVGDDCTTAASLFEALADEDAVAYAHVGGRWADLRQGHDGRIERAMEIHSAWGTFEWLMHDAFDLGHRVGVVANSDGHKGRPGASWPGASTFGAYGGLTCFSASSLTRDGIFEAIRSRRTVATTGCRVDLRVAVAFDGPTVRYADDPALGPTERTPVTVAALGDIVSTASRSVEVSVDVAGHSPIQWIEIRVGRDVVSRHRPYTVADLGSRIAVRYAGAQYRGRGREVRWAGVAEVSGSTIRDVVRVNAFHPDHAFDHDDTSVRFEGVTTGNDGGFDLLLAASPGARLAVRTSHARLDVRLADIDIDGICEDAGGLGMQLSAVRLPDDNPHLAATVRGGVEVNVDGDTPIWVAVAFEDGHRAWSSPITIVPDPDVAQSRTP